MDSVAGMSINLVSISKISLGILKIIKRHALAGIHIFFDAESRLQSYYLFFG